MKRVRQPFARDDNDDLLPAADMAACAFGVWNKVLGLGADWERQDAEMKTAWEGLARIACGLSEEGAEQSAGVAAREFYDAWRTQMPDDLAPSWPELGRRFQVAWQAVARCLSYLVSLGDTEEKLSDVEFWAVEWAREKLKKETVNHA